MSVRSVVKKPLAWFKADNNIRKDFDEEADRKLGASVKQRQIHPVVAKSDGTIVDGERRVRGAKLVGLESLDTIIIDEPLSQTEIRLAQAATATHRAELTAWEKYQLCYELLQLNVTWREKDLAEHLCMDCGYVCRILAASRCPVEVRDAMRDGKLTTADVYALSKADEDEVLTLLQAKLSGAISTREEIERAVKGRKKPTANTDGDRLTRVRAVVAGLNVTVAGKTLGMAEFIEGLGELLKQAKKAARENLDLRTFEAVLRDQRKAE